MADAFTNWQTSRFATPPLTDINAEVEASAQRMQRAGLAVAGSIAPPAPEEPMQPAQRTAKIAYDPMQDKLFIGGYVVDKGNDTDVATVAKFAGQEAPLPEGNWQPVDPTSFTQYVQSITNPSTLTLMAKNFGMGVDEMQQMAGYGLMFAGAEETGRGIVQAQEADLARNQVYNRNFTDIGSAPEQGVLDWMAATIGRLGPNIVESTISAGIGAVAGGASTGPAAPAGAVLGAIGGFFGKAAVKKALLEAAKKQMKGEVLDAAEKKLLLSAAGMTNAASNAARTRLAPGAFTGFMDEGLTAGAEAVMKQAPAIERRMRQIGGGIVAGTGSNIFQQTGAAYGETMADGGEGSRAVALPVGIIGGLADTLPELLLAGRLFSEAAGNVVGAAKTQRTARDILKGAASGRTGKIATGAAAGAGIEGGTEGFQEVLQIAANPVIDLSSPEAATRIINAFAAGALMGGTLGGAGNAFAGSLADNKTEANLLLPVSQNDPGYAQYLIDLKKQIGEEEYKKVFAPPQPYTRIMEEEALLKPAPLPGREEFESAARAGLDLQRQAALEAQRAAAQQFVGGTPPVGQPVPAERLLGIAPQIAPVTPDQQRRQEAAAFFGGQAPAAPVSVPVTPTPAVAQQQAAQQQQLQAQQQGAQQFFGGQAAPQPVNIPPAPAFGTVAPLPIAPVVADVPIPMVARPAAEQQAIRRGREVADLRRGKEASRQTAAMRGEAQRFVAGPQRQPIAQAPMGAGMTTTFQVPPAAPAAAVAPTGPAFGMSGAAAAALQRLQRGKGKKAGKTTVNVPTGTAAQIELPTTGTVPARVPSPPGGRIDAVAFLSTIVSAGQNTFTIADLGSYLFPKKTKLNTVDRNRVNAVIDGLIKNKLVSEGPIGTYNVDTEKVRATQPGAGTEGAKPAGERAGKDRGAGKGDTVRRGAKATAKEPAPEAQGPAAGDQQVQTEEAVQPAVTATSLAETWDRANRSTRANEWQGGAAEANPAFNAVGQDGMNIPAHGMAKVATLGKGVKDLISLLTGEGNPKLNYAPIAMPPEAATGQTTPGGVAYRDGPFIITFRQGSTDTSPANATGVLVNPAHPELVAPLQEMFPNLTVRTFDQVADVVAASKKTPTAVDQALRQGRRGPKAEGEAAPSKKPAKSPKQPKPPVEKVKPYKDLTEEEQLALAKEAEKQGTTIATLMEREQDVPDLPPKATKVEADLYEVYGTIGNIILAQRDNKKAGVSVKEAAKAAFIDNVGTLYNWATKPGTAQEAKNTALAFLDAQISASETLPLKEGVKQAIKDAEQGMFQLSQFDAVNNPVDENGRPAKGVNPIRVRAIVDKFRSGLAKAPRFYVYKNQADLQRRNPELYQRAVAARPQGDFDTASASGYAFDDTVLVFTDRIPTEKHMRFLLAHEAIGHYGMRSLLPAKQFDALMDYVYENNPKLKLSIDGALKGSKDLGARREAVEEHMAKFAETLDSSILRRVWSAIKDVLNKLGVKFEDDIVRYLVSQARSTVRNGSSMFTPSTFALNLQTVMTNNGTGRFSTVPIYTGQHEARNTLDLMNKPLADLGEMQQALKDWGINTRDTFEVIMRNVFRLRNYNALRNHGAQSAEHIKDAMRTAAQSLNNTWNNRLAKLLAMTGGPRQVVSYALVISRRVSDRRFKLDRELRDAPLIVLGDVQPNGLRELSANQPVLDKLIKLGTLTRDELNNGVEITYEEPVGDGTFKKATAKVKGLKDELKREITDEEYALYVQTRRDLADLDIERLKAQYDNYFTADKISTAGIDKILADETMTPDDIKFVRDVVNHAKKLFVDEIEYDSRGMPEATTNTAARMEQYFKAVNTAVVKRELTEDLKQELRKFYLPKPKKDADGKVQEPSAEVLAEGNKKSEAAIKKLEEFRSRRKEFTGREEQSVIYTLQDRVKEIVLADAAFERAQMYVRRSIASSHVPLWREGTFQVRVEAQVNGRTVELHPEVQNKLLYSLSDSMAGAENDAKFYNDTMKDIEYSGLVRDDTTGEYKTQTFKVFARASKTVDSVSSEPSLDIDNFLYVQRVLGIPLAPDKHAKAITMLTAPGSALRKSLRFDDTPGYDPSRTVDAIARHVTTRASLIAKTRFQPVLRDLMNLKSDTGQKWFGDKEAVIQAKERLDAATDQKQKDYWQDRLNTELYRYVTTNPGAKGWDGSRATFVNQPTKADLGMRDYSETVKELDAVFDSPNINEATFEGKRYAALAKMVTSLGFLGGMFTQFAQNLMSPATNVLPYLASKDSQTGFGGGFGAAVMPTYLKAFKDVVGWRGLKPFVDPIEDAKAFEKLANDLKAARDVGDTAKEAEIVQRTGLTYYEALNIAREIREGKLIPAQANALLETSRGLFTGRFGKGFLKFSDWYMSPFNVSEQATRRATFLTAFRLEFDRLKGAGFAEDKASEMARTFAVDTVDKTLGEYSNTNRPPVWRDGPMSLLFVYKTYPLTSLLLFKNLSRGGKIGMLTALYVLAGAAGFPLVDDLEDLIDTLSQRFGLDIGQGPAVRMAIIRQLEEVFPGMSDMILRGPLNHYTGADVGAKFGLEDFLPGTGIFLKGANTTEELKGIAGPVVGMGLSIGKFIYDAGRAPLSSTVSAVDVARESPFSLVRAVGDVAAYMQNGAIVDRRGYVVSPELSAATMISRILGFYPADAARQYDFIKYANRMNYDYKEVGNTYKLAWIKAMMTGDTAQAQRIVREVNDWNEANKGGPGVIRNFLKNAQKALKEARRPAGERFLKSAPVASRASFDRFMEYIVE